MYTLYLGKSRSANYPKAVRWMQLMGATQKGEDWVLNFIHEIKAYRAMFPLFRLKAMEWKNTRAYVNGKRVNPYRFVFQQHQRRNTFFAEVLEDISPEISLYSLLDPRPDPEPYLYHKREGNRFFFQGTEKSFDLELKGKRLYEFIDQYDIGDIIYFE